MAEPQSSHQSVLLSEVLEALAPLESARIVDGTFGAGGYSRALLNAGASVVGIDRDPTVAPFVAALKAEFPDRFSFVAGAFSELDTLAGEAGIDGVVLDIGVSSMQVDQAERGFSFMRSGPLDMRMSREGESAADLVNTLSETDLANLIFAFGEERASRRIAKAIVAARASEPINDTLALAQIIEKAVGRKPGAPHPATRTFQALRIAVNGEFDELVEALYAAERILPEGGRLAVVTFHSLEDRIVKRFFDQSKTAAPQSRHLPQVEPVETRWAPVRKAIKAGAVELERNARSRSATLRSAVRTAAPARAVQTAGLGVPGFRRGAA
ncbi:16S rRNA (cytosine(1402)-N(4))-methyltransferase RsmH [Pelagibacterium sp. 26DY04]|uniref:16S rRNA (cytosine(1402)-N(4))-methyltransferase RsmH n=1 Tax=Pelagibacterium sp. 26DY04 TaxID=2967130 RepID=UPI002815AFFB|nr:16S rRNA (cytosine(1402)-N(4))-methyltransferase RsmH [Pelagibacterium sp. 26DY04]WMT85844.1 16S rRNA (cytosine(1402)-N(4))-methyltransferase RsmH [Pelagibacterium sp. 26DY04]